MHEPDDFGFDPCSTLAHVGDPTPPPGFTQFWAHWSEELWAAPATFQTYDHANPATANGVDGTTHIVRSTAGVRIGCRVDEPAAPLRAVAISLHGYELPSDAPFGAPPELSRDTGLATVQMRLRGYPGSRFDVGDLCAEPGGYLSVGLERESSWILGGAVADVVNVYRACRARYGWGVPIELMGESFGGGLAVLAASALGGLDTPFRLVLGLPSLGDWEWRLQQRTAHGAGADVKRFIDANRSIAHQVHTTLRLFDAIIHARRIFSPVLCKLALRDEVVPAPSAAAVFNALGTAPGLKWRFITEFGHHDGGIADLRRHAQFSRITAAFLDPGVYPATIMAQWEPALNVRTATPPAA